MHERAPQARKLSYSERNGQEKERDHFITPKLHFVDRGMTNWSLEIEKKVQQFFLTVYLIKKAIKSFPKKVKGHIFSNVLWD